MRYEYIRAGLPPTMVLMPEDDFHKPRRYHASDKVWTIDSILVAPRVLADGQRRWGCMRLVDVPSMCGMFEYNVNKDK